MRTSLRFDLNGVSVEVDIPASAARDAIAARFDRCPPAPPGDADVAFVVRTGSGTGRPEGRGRPVYPWDVGEVTYFDGPRSLYISVGDHTRLLAEPASGRVEITTHAAMLDAAWLLARPLLTLPLVELLKWRGRFSLHAAGVVIADRALLLAGPSGSGKSTLALALARDRLDFMADDMVFLTQDGPGVRVHPFPEEVDVSVETAAWFEELAGLGALEDGWPKHRVHADRVFATRLSGAAEPGALVFPSIGGARTSSLEPMSADEALVQLAPNVLLTDPDMAQSHLDALGVLARTTPCYRLSTGTDLQAAAETLRDLIDS